ncbi:hypothetical protein BJ508DRAFT_332467 [Ascobolus immersus RN42]|uniref:Uncharacterized protein n=1 Tax=Ascobolus immersus RN42 TaxID=1160509 RepID=A0A3N4HMP8_ASCIM|nr:hypothetical protein BJ508DRAFT_332467 [Ascobolus immersus RN42]
MSTNITIPALAADRICLISFLLAFLLGSYTKQQMDESRREKKVDLINDRLAALMQGVDAIREEAEKNRLEKQKQRNLLEESLVCEKRDPCWRV